MSEENNKKEVDELSGVETTGHEWDGLKELNNPLPRWWVWVWIASIVWSIWYFVIYPAWPVPGGATEGMGGYTQYKELVKSQSEIAARKAEYLGDFEKASFEEVMDNPGLYEFALRGGAAAFKDNCATCHGSGAEGGNGYPNLNDDDWLWGGTIEDIYTTLQHGVRIPNDYDARQSQMPAFGKDGLLNREEINEVVDYVLALSDKEHGHGNMEHGHGNMEEMPGYEIFQLNCASCHGEDGKGSQDFGAPNLTDAIWLYGGNRATVFETVYNARGGLMPAWKTRLDNNTIRQLAIYVHELGGGEEMQAMEVMDTPVESVDIIEEAVEEIPAQDMQENIEELQDEVMDEVKEEVEDVMEDLEDDHE